MTPDNENKPDCSQHSKDLFGHADMKEVAEAIGNLDYETLYALFSSLEIKLLADYKKDNEAGRKELAMCLYDASIDVGCISLYMRKAYQISKPYMK